MRGKLLIASPGLYDFFRRTVVLVVEHSDEGALGVVLNRPSEAMAAEAAPALVGTLEGEEPIWIGGPVAEETLVVLAEYLGTDESPKPVAGCVGIFDPDGPPVELGRVRAFAGHAGWGPGQLDEELERESWIVEDADPDRIFAEGDLWADVLRARGGKWALLATMPEDPTAN